MAALSLISTISITLGSTLDYYTIEIILSNLMKCSVVTKKLIATKVEEVTKVFLSHTPFSPKAITMLCKSMTEKNVQLRQLCCTYIQTILQTHGSQESVRAIVEKSETSFSIDDFLKKELVDASPFVRDACRSLYWTYYKYWPEKAKKVYDVLDLPTQKALGRSKPASSISPATSPTKLAKTASISSATSPTKLVKTPLLKRSASERSSIPENTSLPLPSRNVPVKTSSSLPVYSRPIMPKGAIIRSNSSPVAPTRIPSLAKLLKQKPSETKTSVLSRKRKSTWSFDADEQGPRRKVTKKVATESQKRKGDSLAQESDLSNKRRKSVPNKV